MYLRLVPPAYVGTFRYIDFKKLFLKLDQKITFMLKLPHPDYFSLLYIDELTEKIINKGNVEEDRICCRLKIKATLSFRTKYLTFPV